MPPCLLPHFLWKLSQGPESGWQTVMSNLWVSKARSLHQSASLWPQSNCYRKITSLRDGHSVPPTDSLLRFLVESSSDEYPSCANCDRNEKSPMFFCNTCGKWSGVGGGGRTHQLFSLTRCNLIKEISKLKSTTLEQRKIWRTNISSFAKQLDVNSSADICPSGHTWCQVRGSGCVELSLTLCLSCCRDPAWWHFYFHICQ